MSAIESLLAATMPKIPVSKFEDDNTNENALLATNSKITLDPVTMRITGLTCQQVLLEHKNVVSGIVVVPPGHGRDDHFLVSFTLFAIVSQISHPYHIDKCT